MILDTDITRCLHERGICVIIPTFNNETTLIDVVSQVREICQDVIVINDGSTDNTANLLKERTDITVLSYEKNRGKGYALKTGFRKAREMGFAYAITIDADGQHKPQDIPKFLQANKEHPGAIIVGKRNLENVERSKGSNFANKFSNFWFALQTGRRLKDTQTGYRLYPIKKLKGLSLLTNRYEAELELMVFASWHGVKIFETSVDVYYPPKEERVSHFRPGMDFFRISLLNTFLCGLALLYGLPLAIFRWLIRFLRNAYTLITFVFFSIFVVTPAAWLYVKIGKMTEKKKWNLHLFINWLAKFFMIKHGIPGTKFSYKVHEEVDFNKPHVIICNHQSHFDLMCQLIFSPKMIFLTKTWVINNPFYGFVIRHADYIPVRDGLEQIMPKLKELVDKGFSIALYPEGTRSENCDIARFHQGAFYIADKLNIGILPMCLYGTGKVLPKTKFSLRKGPIYIEVDKSVSLDELRNMGEYRQQASQMRKYYINKYESIANRIEQDV